MEVRPGIYALQGPPTKATYAALKGARITPLINLRRDGEPSFNLDRDTSSVLTLRINYQRLAVSTTLSKDDLESFGMILGSFPTDARVVVYCGDGNRTGGLLCVWLVKEKRRKVEDALTWGRQVGLREPEAAVRRLLGLP